MKNIDTYIIVFLLGSIFIVGFVSLLNLEPVKYAKSCPKHWCKISETTYELKCKRCLTFENNTDTLTIKTR